MRLGIVSDIHGNRHALEACLERLDRESPDVIYCLGDVVGYGPDPASCVQILRTRAIPCVLGNHDAAATTGEGLETFNPLAASAANWTRDQLDPEQRAWLAERPRSIELDEVVLGHGAPGDIHRYVLASVEMDELIEAHGRRFVLCGHTHLPVLHAVKDGHVVHEVDFPETRTIRMGDEARAFVNPGSVGQPRDGVVHASCALIDLSGAEVSILRVPYDIDAVMDRILARGLPEPLATRLSVGH